MMMMMKKWRARRPSTVGIAGTLLVAATVASVVAGTDPSGAETTLPEPTDDALLRAVVESMRLYYARRALRTEPTRRRLAKRDEEMACYEGLGCFRDEGPFDYLDVLPSAPDQIQTRFLLYTRRRPDVPFSLHHDNASALRAAPLDRTKPFKMLVHGFGSSCGKRWATDLRRALLRAEDANVVCVDWEAGAALPHYVQAAANTRLVGRQVARLIAALNRELGTDGGRFHLIGFSLGAHVAGFAGEETEDVGRITGLDPAAPLFEGYSTEARLDSSDARFVDVIHSNGDSLLYGGLGAFDAMGHADYYPNGGKVQAGCSNIFVGALSDLIWHQPRSVDGRGLCNHRRAYKFFTDSVLDKCAFPAFACDDYDKFLRGECFPCGRSKSECGNMGYFADRSAGRGKLYLLTRNAEPFCAHQFKVTIESSSHLAPTYGALELTLVDGGGRNETFRVTSEWEQLVPGTSLTRVVVAHPAMTDLVSAQIRYTPYKGWITSGLEQWAVDRLVVVDSFGKRYSLCRRGVPLAEHKPTVVHLSEKDCAERTTTPDATVDGDDVENAVDAPLSRTSVAVVPPAFRRPFVPRPRFSNNATIDGVVYDVGLWPGGDGVEPSREWRRAEIPAVPFDVVGWRPTDGDRLPERLGRELSFEGVVPAVGAQIVFVPGGLPRRRKYIPLRPLSDERRRLVRKRLAAKRRSGILRRPRPR